jgi:parallel beta-helix repeat protein
MALAVRPAEEVHAANFTVNLLTDLPDLGDTDGDGAFDLGEGDGGGTAGCDTDAATSGSQCTLRAAIYEANRNGDTADTITFGSLSGTINISLTLPVGASDPSVAGADGLAASTTIDGNGTVTVDGGAFACFTVSSPSNVIRDLLITGCTDGVLITGDPADGNAVRGNTIFANTDDGIEISGGDNNTIGGTSTADRNIIRDNTNDGVAVSPASDGNVIEGNCIGTLASCSVAAPNGDDGVEINGSNNTVGGTAAGASNTIAFNGSDGVEIAAGTGNVVTRNVMFLNTLLGIASGAAPTMTGCADAGGGNVSCTGNSVAGNIVDVYHANVDVSGPEGDKFLCTTVAGGGGAWGCTFPNPGGGSATATQRDPGGVNNTSAFSAAVGIPAGPVITPTFTPTVTPTSTPTATGTPPTATPTRTSTPVPGAATATPTTGPMESVTLVGGTCNPVASSYPDNTPIATIAGAVSPSGILISIWKFEPSSGAWLGYSPQAPQASNLTQVNRLDAIFICVSSAGSWSRPKI